MQTHRYQIITNSIHYYYLPYYYSPLQAYIFIENRRLSLIKIGVKEQVSCSKSLNFLQPFTNFNFENLNKRHCKSNHWHLIQYPNKHAVIQGKHTLFFPYQPNSMWKMLIFKPCISLIFNPRSLHLKS